MPWQLLDVNSIWMKEFASALGRYVPGVNWSPVMSWTGMFQQKETEALLADPPLKIRQFPLQRLYSRFPVSSLVNLGKAQVKRMERLSSDSSEDPLICTTPYYAPVAEFWPGPVIYYQTDLTFAYAGADSALVRSLDIRMCRVARLVCPNSKRVGHYLVSHASCDPGKIQVLPNATRQANLLTEPSFSPAVPPADIQDLPRPLVGVIGNLAANLNWRLLEDAVQATPDFSWVFVGPTRMDIPEEEQSVARKRLMEAGKRVRFIGNKPYSVLQEYARTFDVAVLPYRRKEPTFSGSSTRFYEHLAACRPMIATRGFEELLHKEPLLHLVRSADQIVEHLRALAQSNFVDGYEETRWRASLRGTWDYRARTMLDAMVRRGCQTAVASGHMDYSSGVEITPEPLELDRAPFELITPD